MDLRGRSLLKVTGGPVDRDGQVRGRDGQGTPGEQPGDEHDNDGDRPVRPDLDPGHPATRYLMPHWPSPPASNIQAETPPPCLTGSRRGTSGIMAADA
jgi:hypothetical protein